ncbi:replication initiator protein A [Methylobacterium sp. NEAU K]|uniref:replication initiator protein A n=1 Tax=Methylobacterium sp. NEAU K TaxID=3064946 RepID=UPI0027363E97|nr:replication initiator protein A [Methylobacterium sp. NEAU K]MDP4006318.1 replication initiator protein A [Methylobacterium sp. NEAU K]
MTTVASHRRSGALTGPRSFTVVERYPVLSLTAREPGRTGPHGGEFRGIEGGLRFFLRTHPARIGDPLATLADGGVLTFVATLLTHRLNLQQSLAPPLIFTSAACLRALGRPVGGQQHRLLAAQIARLSNTVMSTDLRGQHDCHRIIERAERVDGRWQIDVSPFLTREVQEYRILQIDPCALDLRGLERRIYGWARTYCGGPTGTYALPLKRAFVLSGSTDKPRRFRHALNAIVESNRLPGINLSLSGDGADTVLTLVRQEAGRQPPPQFEKAAPEELSLEDIFGPMTPELAEIFGQTDQARRTRTHFDTEDLLLPDGL